MIKPKTHDEYLQNYTGQTRKMLDGIRALVQELVPEAEEYIGYGIPAFRLKGKYFIGYGGAKHHCAIYPGSGILEKFAGELTDYDTSKGTLRLNPEEPLPVELLTPLILNLKRNRLAENKK